MKTKNIIYIALLTVTVFLSFSSCGEDRSKEYAQQTNLDRWIDSTMREKYYWYEDMPAAKGLNYFTDPETFFTSLLSSEDGKSGNHYSTIENISETKTRSIYNTKYSYGFDYRLFSLNESTSTYIAQLLYVAPDSPASEAGLNRGDWIVTMNGDSITETNYSILYGGGAMEIHLAKYRNGSLNLAGSAQLGAARTIEDDPLLYHNIFSWAGKNVGYLVYNHFSSGPDNSDNTYNNELLGLSKEFKSAGVNEFILDLRYNNGGLLSCARLLSTILAPATALNQTFCYLEYNKKQSPQVESSILDASLISSGANLNLQTVYVLVSGTTASASELVINALKPYMNIVIIGTQTEGKNVGSITYTNKTYMWAIHPIVCKLYNASNESDYVNGFTPDYTAEESAENLDYFLPFGDSNELLLSTALSIIDDSYAAGTKTKASTIRTLKLKEIANSLDRKAGNGVIIDR